MKESYRKGVANHPGLESCVAPSRGGGRSVDRGIGGPGIELRKTNSGRRPCGQKGKATRPVARTRAAGRPCVVVDPGHAEKLHAREPGDLGIDWPRADQSGGRRQKPNGPHARCRGVGPRCSTDEASRTKPSHRQRRLGREEARTKENTSQSHTLSTQGEDSVSQGLQGVRQAARERKQERFTALLHHLSIDLLRESFLRIKATSGAGGGRRDVVRV